MLFPANPQLIEDALSFADGSEKGLLAGTGNERP